MERRELRILKCEKGLQTSYNSTASIYLGKNSPEPVKGVFPLKGLKDYALVSFKISPGE